MEAASKTAKLIQAIMGYPFYNDGPSAQAAGQQRGDVEQAG